MEETSGKVIVNPTFRLDVDGKLFKNKNSNMDMQETIYFNNLMTRLSINKGDIVHFPEMGLKQHLSKFNFVYDTELVSAISDFESDIETQMGRSCTINYQLDRDNQHVDFDIDGKIYNDKTSIFLVSNSNRMGGINLYKDAIFNDSKSK